MNTKRAASYLSALLISLISVVATGPRAYSTELTRNKIKDGNEAMPGTTEKARLNSMAPDFELPNASGEKVRLSDFRGKQPVVVYFYPKDETSICTAEACAFRDSYEDFKKEGAEVIGISSDPVDAHKKFATNHNLPFVLLSDAGAKVRSAWGVPTTMGILPGRVTYVIDKAGVIRLMFESQMQAKRHIEEAMETLSKLKTE
jgi:thioredoxin-dependent peroxiredoxin